jgi:hypothetical protein
MSVLLTKNQNYQKLTRTTGCAFLQSSWFWVIACVAAALPVLVCRGLPPLTDLGGHLGRYAVQIDAGRSADLSRWYSFHWDLLPNLGVDLLMQFMAPLFGLEPALMVIVVAIPVLQVSGFLMLARVVHGRISPLTLFALPLAYSYPFQFGFLNFVLSTALAVWALVLWIWLGEREQIMLRSLVFLPICVALWVCHLVGWSLFCIFATTNELAKAYDRGLSWRTLTRHVLLPLSCLATPLVIDIFWRIAFGGHEKMDELLNMDDLFNNFEKLGFLLMPLRDSWMAWDLGATAVLLGLIVWGWLSSRFSRHRGLALGVICLAVIYAIMPGTVLGSAMADMRLVPMLFAMALIAVRPPLSSDRRIALWLVLGGITFAGARFAGNALSLMLLDSQFDQDLAILDKIPSGATVISLSVEPCEKTFLPWERERRAHLGGYAIARRHQFSNDQWVRPGGQLLRVNNPAVEPFSSDMSQIASYPTCQGEKALSEYVTNVPSSAQYLWILYDGVEDSIAGWHPVLRSPGSVLYAADND